MINTIGRITIRWYYFRRIQIRWLSDVCYMLGHRDGKYGSSEAFVLSLSLSLLLVLLYHSSLYHSLYHMSII